MVIATGCRLQKPVIYEHKADTIVITKERTIIDTVIGMDSAIMMAFFKCDSANNVYLSRLSQLQGQSLRLAVDYNNGLLKLKAESPVRNKIDNKMADSIIVQKQVIYKEKFIEKEKPYSFWTKCQIYGFRILLIIIIIWFITTQFWKTIKKIISFKLW